jgi:hypothetical protein
VLEGDLGDSRHRKRIDESEGNRDDDDTDD